MNPTVDVLIVGAGPTGLTAAIELSRRGVPVRIVDAANGPCPGSRGKGIQPRTLEIFDDFDVIDRILCAGRTDMGIRYYDRDRLLGEIRTDMGGVARPDVPYPNLLWIPQWHVERILAERLAGLGSTVEYGITLVDLHQRDDVVAVELAGPNGPLWIHPRYVIAADGGHSRARKLLGVAFKGDVLGEERMVLGDVSVDGLDSATAHFWMDPEAGLLMITPFAGTHSWQLLASVKADAQGRVPDPSVNTFQQIVIERTGLPDVRVHHATWLSQRSQVNMRMANLYRVGRVFLAGDAAHVHSPAGAQAMNTGIQDAYNLGWKLAAVLAGAPDRLLDSYQQERLPVTRQVLKLSANLHRMFSSVCHATDVSQALGASVGAGTNQLDIGYRGSALAVNLGREDLPVTAPPMRRSATPTATRYGYSTSSAAPT